MSDKPRRSWQRRVGSLLIYLCVCWLVYAESMNLIDWYFARDISQLNPNLAVVPTPLTDTRVEDVDGLQIEKFGVSFRVPWKEIVRDSTAKTAATLSFKGGGGILIFDPAAEIDGATVMRGRTPKQQRPTDTIFSPQTLSSNYQFMAAEAQVVPSDVKWWATGASNARNGVLLMNKSINLKHAKAIHKIESGSMRGFQYGDPMVPPYEVSLDLFDGSDWHYSVTIVSQNDHPVITQAQVNGLVASFRGLSGGR